MGKEGKEGVGVRQLILRIQTPTICSFFKKVHPQPWFIWLRGLSAGLRTKGLPVQFPVRAQAWVAGQVPSRGHVRAIDEVPLTLMFLSLSFSLPSSL